MPDTLPLFPPEGLNFSEPKAPAQIPPQNATVVRIIAAAGDLSTGLGVVRPGHTVPRNPCRRWQMTAEDHITPAP